MKILVTGSSGLIGSALAQHFTENGCPVIRLVRGSTPRASGDLGWDPDSGQLEESQIEGFDAVVHLAGKNIASGRWTPAMKAEIRASRVRSTRMLCEALRKLERPPKVLASASSIGIYGNRGAEMLTEADSAGTGFLAEVTKEWEASTKPAAEKGIRVIHLRFGVVLSLRGGALARMLPPFKMGLGGALGTGEQYWSWIAIHDAVRAIHHALVTDSLVGPVNIVSPAPVTNLDFTLDLGAALRRPAFLKVPAFAARLAFGEMADEALLASTRVFPAKLRSNGFTFQHQDLPEALRSLLPK